jgi:hypothetical protein
VRQTAPVLERHLPYRIAGAYFESCNCDAICPCRRIDGVPGGRSTHGVCIGVLSWEIAEGHAGGIPLDGLNAALVYRYDDDDPGSPWLFRTHVDARGDESQREALIAIVAGRLGGELVRALPWVRKPSTMLDARASRIELDHSDGHVLRVGEAAAVRASQPASADHTVSCIVPGHDRPGTEYVAERHVVDDAPFAWELETGCAFVASFDYRSEDAATI